jgi:hypothetical protein
LIPKLDVAASRSVSRQSPLPVFGGGKRGSFAGGTAPILLFTATAKWMSINTPSVLAPRLSKPIVLNCLISG